jgi:hypothetical protein
MGKLAYGSGVLVTPKLRTNDVFVFKDFLPRVAQPSA